MIDRRVLQPLPWLLLIGTAVGLSVAADNYILTVATVTALWAILATGLNFSMGYAGLVHLGLGAFYGFGAYGAALLATREGMPMYVPLITMPIAALVIGGLIGPLFLRTRGLHFAVATLGIGIIFTDIANNWVSFTKGPIGIAGIERPGALSSLRAIFALTAALLIALLAVAALLHRWRGSLVLRGVRDDELLSRSIGFRVTYYKVGAFALSGAFAAVAGVLYAYFVQYISPEPFTFFAASFQIFVLVAVGGPGTVWGPVVGAVLLTAVPEFYDMDPQNKIILYGAAMLAVIALLPGGIVPGLGRLGELPARLRAFAGWRPPFLRPATPPQSAQDETALDDSTRHPRVRRRRMLTGSEYQATLADGRATFLDGERVEDLPGHPILGRRRP